MARKSALLFLAASFTFLISGKARADGPYGFFPLQPCRVVDTRGPVGPLGGPALAANTLRSFFFEGVCGIPSTARAVVFNVTAIQATDVGDLRIFPFQVAVPFASVINFGTTDFALANGAIIPLTNGTRISVLPDMPMGSTGHVHLVLDVTGYFQPDPAPPGSPSLLQDGRPAAAADPKKTAAIATALGHMPLSFIENRGQLDPRVAYSVLGRDTALYFSADGMTIVLTGPRRGEKGGIVKASLRQTDIPPRPASRSAVKLDFIGANRNPRIRAGDPLPARFSYFKGPRETWKTGLSTYGSITYSDLWPGIDLIFSGTAVRLKSTFVVKPGADPARIRLAYRGASSVRLNKAGQLALETPFGELLDDKPFAYQEAGGDRVEVLASYSLDRGRRDEPRQYGFAVASYDRSRPLLLDPAVLVYSGFIGGGTGTAIALDTSGNAYVTGWATEASADTFPVSVGPDLTYNGGATDAFVAKINAAGTALLYCGYIGGNGFDYGLGIAVDTSGNAYVTGRTSSSQASFPVTVGPDLTFNGTVNTYDAFVAKVNAAGTALVYCGYIGGSGGDEQGSAIAVDSSGNAYVAGYTNSTETTFPVTVGPSLTLGGGYDAFVAKVNAAGTALAYCGYIGGSFEDKGFGIAVDGSGNAYVTGYTNSTEATFPVKVGPGLTYDIGLEAFVAKVNPDGSALLYCGYIGGGSKGNAIAVDGSGNAYVTGQVDLDETHFPVTVGPDLTFNGATDAFVTKVNTAGTALVYCGYIGGSGDDVGFGIAVDGAGNAYVTGRTTSTEGSFPVTGGPDLTFNGGTSIGGDAFVAKVNASGAALVYCGYIGGEGDDVGNGIAVDVSGNAYVVGQTNSTIFVAKVGTTPDSAATGYFTVTPCRVADTRNPPGPRGGPALAANTTRSFPAGGVCGIPEFAKAVVINLAVVAPTNDGDLRVHPAGAAAPLASGINFRPGIVRANIAIVPLGAGGQISVQCDMPSGGTDFFFDVFGYFQ